MGRTMFNCCTSHILFLTNMKNLTKKLIVHSA